MWQNVLCSDKNKVDTVCLVHKHDSLSSKEHQTHSAHGDGSIILWDFYSSDRTGGLAKNEEIMKILISFGKKPCSLCYTAEDKDTFHLRVQWGFSITHHLSTIHPWPVYISCYIVH